MSDTFDQEFVRLLREEGTALAGFVRALVGDRHAAEDLTQSTCLELWRIRRKFRLGSHFGAWARTVAKFQILRYFRKSHRERARFSPAVLDAIERTYEDPAAIEERAQTRAALVKCLETLSASERTLLKERYVDSVPLKVICDETGSAESRIKMRCLRLRRRLARCIRARLSGEARIHE